MRPKNLNIVNCAPQPVCPPGKKILCTALEPLYVFPPIRGCSLFQVLNTGLIIFGSATLPFAINLVSQSFKFKFINISLVKCLFNQARFSSKMAYLPSLKNLANKSLRNCEVRQVLCIIAMSWRCKLNNVCIFCKIIEFSVVLKRNNTCQML